jgi:hypothetical protein
VAAVNVCLRLSGAMKNPSPQATTVGCQDEAVAADGRVRRVVRRTFALRNIVP